MRYALMNSAETEVVNVVDLPDEGVQYWGDFRTIACPDSVQIGDIYVSGHFEPGPRPEVPWIITSQALFDRLRAHEFAIRKAAIADADVAAVVQMADARASINLRSQRLPAMLDVLVGKGLINQTEADAVVNTAPAEAELFRG